MFSLMFIELKRTFTELKTAVEECRKPCSKKFFWHNLSCELRRGRYKTCYNYKNIWRNRFLFSLGVLVMDFWGMRYKTHISRFKTKLDMRVLDQWLVHPFPWVRFMCRQGIRRFNNKSRKENAIIEEYKHHCQKR